MLDNLTHYNIAGGGHGDSRESAVGFSNKQWGEEAENIVADWLRARGWKVREQRWRAGKTIEIDIIAQQDTEIVFIEVKARRGDMKHPLETIDEKKIIKMCKGADIYLRHLPHLHSYRFDIVTVTGNRNNYKIDHYPDAFLPPFSTK